MFFRIGRRRREYQPCAVEILSRYRSQIDLWIGIPLTFPCGGVMIPEVESALVVFRECRLAIIKLDSSEDLVPVPGVQRNGFFQTGLPLRVWRARQFW